MRLPTIIRVLSIINKFIVRGGHTLPEMQTWGTMSFLVLTQRSTILRNSSVAFSQELRKIKELIHLDIDRYLPTM